MAGVGLHESVVVARESPGVEEPRHEPLYGIANGGEIDGVLGCVGIVAEVDEVEVGLKG